MTQVLAVEERKDEREIYYKLKGNVATLEELQAGVGGNIDILNLPSRKQLMIINEESKYTAPKVIDLSAPFPLNFLASRIFFKCYGGMVPIYGDVLICDYSEVE